MLLKIIIGVFVTVIICAVWFIRKLIKNLKSIDFM